MYKQFLKNASNYLSELQSPRLQLQAHQPTRRAALKLMAGSTAGVALPFAATVAAHSPSRPPSPRSPHQSDVGHSMAKMQVEIITGQSTPEDTVLLSTTADHPVLLKQFMPGILAVEDRMLDLNQVLVSGALEVAPEAEKSILLPSLLSSRQHQPDPAPQAYLLADGAVEVLQAESDADFGALSGAAAAIASTQIITLQALVDADGIAVLYVPSGVDAVGMA